jgi:hypothetical protein
MGTRGKESACVLQKGKGRQRRRDEGKQPAPGRRFENDGRGVTGKAEPSRHDRERVARRKTWGTTVASRMRAEGRVGLRKRTTRGMIPGDHESAREPALEPNHVGMGLRPKAHPWKKSNLTRHARDRTASGGHARDRTATRGEEAWPHVLSRTSPPRGCLVAISSVFRQPQMAQSDHDVALSAG